MATYVIGDVHGCYDSLQQLIQKIEFNPEHDHLWFVGDLVNRGSQSLQCLQYLISLGKAATMVLGNHDIHLLAAHAGLKKYQNKLDTLQPILQHPDVEVMMDWLRHCPLVFKHPKEKIVMVHAGVPPNWSIKKALKQASKVEKLLQHKGWKHTLKNHFFGNTPNTWSFCQNKLEKRRYAINCFTRMRYCEQNGTLDFKNKKNPEQQNRPSKLEPWFSWPDRKNTDYQIFFGHWSTLGVIDAYHVHSTDTGCLWGGKLTAYCIETHKRITVTCSIP